MELNRLLTLLNALSDSFGCYRVRVDVSCYYETSSSHMALIAGIYVNTSTEEVIIQTMAKEVE